MPGTSGRVRRDVVDVPVRRADPAAGHARDEVFLGDVDEQGDVDPLGAGREGPIECLGLAARSREAIEDGPLVGVVGRQPLEEDVHDRVVGHELAATHVPVGDGAEWRPGSDRRPQQVTRGEDRDPEMTGEDGRLRPLPGARRAKKDSDTH